MTLDVRLPLRDLPWRRTRDPWGVLVSEVMLQQTQVARVIPRWAELMRSHPTPASFAALSRHDVLVMWQGLGYPRRAVALHRAAQRVIELGAFPDTLDGLLALPGVGPYTARAVLAFAFEADVAVVDTNIARVLARVEGRRLTAREVQTAADALVPPGDAWRWNQTLMDVGATLCRPSSPRCSECPLVSRCSFRGVGDDPAVGSAGVSRRQAPYAGSDRQARGDLLRALANGPLGIGECAHVMSRDDVRAAALVDALVRDGLACVVDDLVSLPV